MCQIFCILCIIFFNPADVLLPKKCIDDLIECVTKFNNFAMFAPTYKDESIYKNYELYSKKPVIKNNISEKFGMKEVDIIDGTFIIKKSEFKNIGLFDENIFIYFETWDLSKRVARAGKKMYVCTYYIKIKCSIVIVLNQFEIMYVSKGYWNINRYEKFSIFLIKKTVKSGCM